jgi:hypothetical protein
MKPEQILAIDKQRMEGLSAGEVLEALTKALGDESEPSEPRRPE